MRTQQSPIRLEHHVPPLPVPAGFIGPMHLPGTGRLIWWTGRVAIGLCHQPAPAKRAPSISADWIQRVLLDA